MYFFLCFFYDGLNDTNYIQISITITTNIIYSTRIGPSGHTSARSDDKQTDGDDTDDETTDGDDTDDETTNGDDTDDETTNGDDTDDETTNGD